MQLGAKELSVKTFKVDMAEQRVLTQQQIRGVAVSKVLNFKDFPNARPNAQVKITSSADLIRKI